MLTARANLDALLGKKTDEVQRGISEEHKRCRAEQIKLTMEAPPHTKVCVLWGLGQRPNKQKKQVVYTLALLATSVMPKKRIFTETKKALFCEKADLPNRANLGMRNLIKKFPIDEFFHIQKKNKSEQQQHGIAFDLTMPA